MRAAVALLGVATLLLTATPTAAEPPPPAEPAPDVSEGQPGGELTPQQRIEAATVEIDKPCNTPEAQSLVDAERRRERMAEAFADLTAQMIELATRATEYHWQVVEDEWREEMLREARRRAATALAIEEANPPLDATTALPPAGGSPEERLCRELQVIQRNAHHLRPCAPRELRRRPGHCALVWASLPLVRAWRLCQGFPVGDGSLGGTLCDLLLEPSVRRCPLDSPSLASLYAPDTPDTERFFRATAIGPPGAQELLVFGWEFHAQRCEVTAVISDGAAEPARVTGTFRIVRYHDIQSWKLPRVVDPWRAEIELTERCTPIASGSNPP